jgi:hypothetical protein
VIPLLGTEGVLGGLPAGTKVLWQLAMLRSLPFDVGLLEIDDDGALLFEDG